jgi:fermentation-respiration switch protein FrsA (DUF1100 family)
VRRGHRTIGWIVVASLVAGCSSMLIDRLVFLPDRFVPPPPPGLAERWITTDDGVRLHAWHAPPPEGAPVLVWSHGNGGNVANRGEVILALRDRGVGVLAYDYRGYGKSAGRPSETGVYRDARAAYDDERAHGTPPERIVCFGESLGSAVTLSLALERPCAGVVLVSPFTTLADVARHHYGVLGAVAGRAFDSLSRIPRLDVPVLVVHGDRDDIVPFALGERLYAAAPEPKTFLRVRGAGHNDVLDDAAVIDAVATFALDVVVR